MEWSDISLEEFLEAVDRCFTKSDAIKLLGFDRTGYSYRQFDKIVEDNSIDISHFDRHLRSRSKFERIDKECPVCANTFETFDGHPREKTTCSRSCSNSYFRSGVNNPNWTGKLRYRQKALKFLPNECSVCGYSKVVGILQVHHVDRDRSNNEISNLKILCPTCHMEDHFLAKDGPFHRLTE